MVYRHKGFVGHLFFTFFENSSLDFVGSPYSAFITPPGHKIEVKSIIVIDWELTGCMLIGLFILIDFSFFYLQVPPGSTRTVFTLLE